MSSNKRLSDIIDFNLKRSIKKGEIKPFIDMSSLLVDNRDITKVCIREFKGGGAKFKNGDTLFARILPCLENGKTAKVDCLPRDKLGHGSTEFIVMWAKNQNLTKTMFIISLGFQSFKAYARARMEETSGRQHVAWQSLAEYKFYYPDKETRKKVGGLIKSIDDKIKNNNQVDQTLETTTQAIFKSWFVDFDPVTAKIAVLESGGNNEDVETVP